MTRTLRSAISFEQDLLLRRPEQRQNEPLRKSIKNHGPQTFPPSSKIEINREKRLKPIPFDPNALLVTGRFCSCLAMIGRPVSNSFSSRQTIDASRLRGVLACLV